MHRYGDRQRPQALTVDAVVSGSPGTATIPPAGTETVDLSDLYTDVPGELVATKTIGGVAAGKQGEITIVPTCNGKKLDAVRDPGWDCRGQPLAHLPRRSWPTPRCTVTEDSWTANNHSRRRRSSGSGQEVTIPPPTARDRGRDRYVHRRSGLARREQDDHRQRCRQGRTSSRSGSPAAARRCLTSVIPASTLRRNCLQDLHRDRSRLRPARSRRPPTGIRPP